MNRKILITSIMILLISILLSVNVYAASISSATITITPSKTEYKSGDTVEFTISLKDLEASNGILGLGAYIEYDSNLLTLDSNAKGLSDWTDANISEKTHRFATTKNSHSSNNEDIIKITFTAKEVTSDVTTSISLKKIEISNGTEYDISEINSNNITIKPKSANSENPPVRPNEPNDPNNPDNPNNNPTSPTNPSNPNSSSNTNNPSSSGTSTNQTNPSNSNASNSQSSNNKNNIVNSNNSVSNNNAPNRIPQLGVNEYLLITIAIVFMIVGILFIKIKVLDRKINKEKQNFSDNDDKN